MFLNRFVGCAITCGLLFTVIVLLNLSFDVDQEILFPLLTLAQAEDLWLPRLTY